MEQRGHIDEKRVYLLGGPASPPFEARRWGLVPPGEGDVRRSASAEFPAGLGCACMENLDFPFDIGPVCHGVMHSQSTEWVRDASVDL